MIARVALLILTTTVFVVPATPAASNDALNRALGLGIGILEGVQHRAQPGPRSGLNERSGHAQLDTSDDPQPDRASIRQAQQILNALGYDAGPEDGLMGPRTSTAIADFQRDYGQQVTGTLDDRTLGVLAGAARGTGLETDVALPGLVDDVRAPALTGLYHPQALGLPTLLVHGVPFNDVEALDLGLGDVSIRAERALPAEPGEPFTFTREDCTVSITPTGHFAAQALQVSASGWCEALMAFADIDEMFVRADATEEGVVAATSERTLPIQPDRQQVPGAGSTEEHRSTAQAPSELSSGQRGTITILGHEMAEPEPIEIPVVWDQVRNDIPAELLLVPDAPMTRSEVQSEVAQLATRLSQEFEAALDLLVNIVLASNPEWVDGNLDLYLMDWMADLPTEEVMGASGIALSSGIVITPEAQILVQRLEIDRLYRQRDAVAAILESLELDLSHEQAPDPALDASEGDAFGPANAASPAIALGDPAPTAVQSVASPSSDSPRVGSANGGHAVAVSENWARRSAEALTRGRKREAILFALKGMPEDVSAAQLEAEHHLAYLALYTAMRADILRYPHSDEAYLRAPISASPARDRLVVGAKQRVPMLAEDGWFPDWIEFWDTEAEQIIAEWSDDSLFVASYHAERARFDPEGQLFAIMGDDGRAHLFDAREGRHLSSSEPIAPPMSDIDPVIIHSLDISPLGQYVFATSGFQGGLAVWDAETMSPVLSWNEDDIGRIVGRTHDFAHATGHFIDDGTLCLLAIGYSLSSFFEQDIVAGLLDIATGELTEIFRRQHSGHTARLECGPQNKWMALRHVGIEDAGSASFQMLEMIDMASGEVVHAINDISSLNHLSFNDEETLVGLYGLQGWTFFDLGSGEFIPQPGAPRDFQLGHARFFDAETDDPVHSFAPQLTAFTADLIWDDVPTGPDLVVTATALLTDRERADLDSERVAVTAIENEESAEQLLTVISENWARRSSELLEDGFRTQAIMAALKGLPAHANDVDLEAFAPAHLALYTAFRSHYLRLPLGERIALLGSTIAPDLSRALTLTQMPDGDYHIELWDGEEGQLVSTLLVGATSSVFPEMAISRDASWAAVDTHANTLALHDAADGRLHAEFAFPPPAHQGDFARIVMEFSPRSEYLAAVGSYPIQLQVWQLPGGEPVFALTSADLDRMGMGGSVPVDLRGAWANDTHLCAYVTNPGSSSGFSLIVIDVANGGITNTFLLDPHLDHYDGGAGAVRCSPDLRMAAVTYTTPVPDSVRHMHLLSLESGISKTADLDTHRIYTPRFDPASRMIAADIELGTPRYVYDIALGDFVEHPTALNGFSGPWHGLFNSSADVRLIGKAVWPDVAGLWDEAPQGQGLIEAAMSALSQQQRDEVEQMRLRREHQ